MSLIVANEERVRQLLEAMLETFKSEEFNSADILSAALTLVAHVISVVVRVEPSTAPAIANELLKMMPTPGPKQ